MCLRQRPEVHGRGRDRRVAGPQLGRRQDLPAAGRRGTGRRTHRRPRGAARRPPGRTDRFLPPAETLARQLADILDAAAAIQTGALTRVADAQRAAQADADRALAATREADTLARTARRDADQQIQQMTARLADAELDRSRSCRQ
jgi:hypothetical protein